jgi:hypothetical protein
MKNKQKVEWSEVERSMRDAEKDGEREIHNSVWSKLSECSLGSPNELQWFEVFFEKNDLNKLHVIGSCDWKESFGTYSAMGIKNRVETLDNDPSEHLKRCNDLGEYFRKGKTLPSPILVCSNISSYIVCIDGNHRMIGLMKANKLTNQPVYIGVHENIKNFYWYKNVF